MDFPRSPRIFSLRTILPILVLACTSVLVYGAIIQPWSLRQISLQLSVGDVASLDLRSPRSIQYSSEVLTEAARTTAERAIAPIYNPPDTTIARAQNEALTSILGFINTIRINQVTTFDQKKTEIAAIRGLTLQPTLSLIHISEPTKLGMISYAVF